jgi:hypothetical protein
MACLSRYCCFSPHNPPNPIGFPALLRGQQNSGESTCYGSSEKGEGHFSCWSRNCSWLARKGKKAYSEITAFIADGLLEDPTADSVAERRVLV